MSKTRVKVNSTLPPVITAEIQLPTLPVEKRYLRYNPLHLDTNMPNVQEHWVVKPYQKQHTVFHLSTFTYLKYLS